MNPFPEDLAGSGSGCRHLGLPQPRRLASRESAHDSHASPPHLPLSFASHEPSNGDDGAAWATPPPCSLRDPAATLCHDDAEDANDDDDDDDPPLLHLELPWASPTAAPAECLAPCADSVELVSAATSLHMAFGECALEEPVQYGLTEIIEDALFLGAFRDTCSADDCAQRKIGAYLCVAREATPPRHALESGAPVLHLRLEDKAHERLADHIPAAIAFIDEQSRAGRPVALFCRKGRSRSVAIAAAYVKHRREMASMQAALAFVSGRYPRADPNFWFLQQLQDL